MRPIYLFLIKDLKKIKKNYKESSNPHKPASNTSNSNEPNTDSDDSTTDDDDYDDYHHAVKFLMDAAEGEEDGTSMDIISDNNLDLDFGFYQNGINSTSSSIITSKIKLTWIIFSSMLNI